MTVNISIKTNLGTIVAALNEALAPKTVENFLKYVAEGHYTNTIFHRVIKGFMIQGGGFEAGNDTLRQKAVERTVENEAKNGLRNDKYSIAMARTSAPHSASAQFFINTKNNGFLDYPGQDGWGYAVFGAVTEGFNVVDAIEALATTRKGMFADVPVNEVVIESIAVLDSAPEGNEKPAAAVEDEVLQEGFAEVKLERDPSAPASATTINPVVGQMLQENFGTDRMTDSGRVADPVAESATKLETNYREQRSQLEEAHSSTGVAETQRSYGLQSSSAAETSSSSDSSSGDSGSGTSD